MKPDQTRKVHFSGDEKSFALLSKLGVDGIKDGTMDKPEQAILVLGANPQLNGKEAMDFAEKGGQVLCLPQSPEWLAQLGLKTEKTSLWQAFDPEVDAEFRAVTPKLLRWRDAIEANLVTSSKDGKAQIFAKGAITKIKTGKGSLVLCQVAPSMLSERYKDDKSKAEAIDLSVIRLEQLVASLLSSCGATPSKSIADRLVAIAAPPSFKAIGSWNVYGPFFVDKDDGDAMLATQYTGEEWAVAGTADPNFTVKRSDGQTLSWNKVVKARENGYVNLADAFNRKSLGVGYVATVIDSDSERDTVMRVGCDWRMIIWLNGKEVFRTTFGKNRADSYRVNVHLKKGRNNIGMKIASGTNGFSFYADIAGEESGMQSVYSNDLRASAIFYGGALQMDEFDPYIFRYW